MNKLKSAIFVAFMAACSASSKSDGIKIGSTPGCWQSDYTSVENSEYVLPYSIGKGYLISQGNCGGYSHIQTLQYQDLYMGDRRYAYDFDLPVGTEIVASRNGLVINVDDRYKQFTNNVLKQNFILLKHDDGTVAYYGHITHKGSLVKIGDEVNQGDVIGLSGNTGYTFNNPHLHFEVLEKESKNCNGAGFNQSDKTTIKLSECKSIPITFKNADPMDIPLREGKIYKALDY